MRRYDFSVTETRWQQHWTASRAFEAGRYPDRPPYYVLEMFPYPSGRIHAGHLRNYTMGDVVARYRRALGFDVLHPMGWDAFGLPAENAAIDNRSHPGKWTRENIATMRRQLQMLGLSLDWSREISTCEPDYYRHEQKMFLDFLRLGLVARKEFTESRRWSTGTRWNRRCWPMSRWKTGAAGGPGRWWNSGC